MTDTRRATTARKGSVVPRQRVEVSAPATAVSSPQSEHPQASSLVIACQGELEAGDARSKPIHHLKGRLLHTHQVARRLNVSESGVRGLAQSGELAAFKIGKLWCFWEKDIDDFIQNKSEADPSD